MSKLGKCYLLYTFILMLIGWGVCAICSVNGIYIKEHPLLYITYCLGGWSPTIASFLSLKKGKEVGGFKEWLKHVFDFRHSLPSYIMVVGLSIVVMLPQCLISGYKNGAPIFMLVVMIPMMLFGGGLEEAGWRYILQRELEKKYSLVISTLVVGVIWWLWHLPLFYIQGVGQYGQNYFEFGILVLGMAFALASIRRNTNSVWLCVLFHCLVNSLGGVYITNSNMVGSIVTTVLVVIVSLGLVKFNSKKRIFS